MISLIEISRTVGKNDITAGSRLERGYVGACGLKGPPHSGRDSRHRSAIAPARMRRWQMARYAFWNGRSVVCPQAPTGSTGKRLVCLEKLWLKPGNAHFLRHGHDDLFEKTLALSLRLPISVTRKPVWVAVPAWATNPGAI